MKFLQLCVKMRQKEQQIKYSSNHLFSTNRHEGKVNSKHGAFFIQFLCQNQVL